MSEAMWFIFGSVVSPGWIIATIIACKTSKKLDEELDDLYATIKTARSKESNK